MNKSRSLSLHGAVRTTMLAFLTFALPLFTVHSAGAAAQTPLNLGTAANFAILTKTGITNVPPSDVTGDLGTSPIDSTAITGFVLIVDGSGAFATSTQVNGKVYASNYAAPTPTNLMASVSDMETAYTDAATRTFPDFTELYTGDVSGKILVPGLYKWSTDVLVSTNVTFEGPADAVWVLQIAGNLIFSPSAVVFLSGGARAENIFWQVTGGTGVEVGTAAHVEGNLLAATAIHLRTGSSLNGRALAQTAATLDNNVIVLPLPAVDACGNGTIDQGEECDTITPPGLAGTGTGVLVGCAQPLVCLSDCTCGCTENANCTDGLECTVDTCVVETGVCNFDDSGCAITTTTTLLVTTTTEFVTTTTMAPITTTTMAPITTTTMAPITTTTMVPITTTTSAPPTTTSTTSTTSTTTAPVCDHDCGDPAPVFGAITAVDSQTILRNAVALVACQLCVCDVDSSGAVVSQDALRDLQYAVGLPATLNCPPVDAE